MLKGNVVGGGSAVQFYRYVGATEALAIEGSKVVATLSARTTRTWFTPDRYLTRLQAKAMLAMPLVPTHRTGPYPEDELPRLGVPLQQVQPAWGEPGGGWETAVDQAFDVFGIVALSA